MVLDKKFIAWDVLKKIENLFKGIRCLLLS